MDDESVLDEEYNSCVATLQRIGLTETNVTVAGVEFLRARVGPRCYVDADEDATVWFAEGHLEMRRFQLLFFLYRLL